MKQLQLWFSFQFSSLDLCRLDTSGLAECCMQLGHCCTQLSCLMKTYTPSLKGSQGQHTGTEHNVVCHPWRVQMEYTVHSWKWLRAAVCVVNNTCYFVSPHTGRKRRNSLWVLCPKGYEKFTLQALSIGGNRQTAACLITGSILISLFYLPPWMEAEGLAASDYFPKEAPVGLPRCWFWTACSIGDFLAISQTAFVY